MAIHRKHEDQLVTDPAMLPAKLSARYVADLKKAGVTSEIVESRTTMPRGWDYGNITTLKSGDYLVTFTIQVTHTDLDQASGHAMVDSQVVSMHRAAKPEPVISGMISDVADQIRPMRSEAWADEEKVRVKRAPGRDRWWVSFQGETIGIVAKKGGQMLPAGVREWVIEEAWKRTPLAISKLNEAIRMLKEQGR